MKKHIYLSAILCFVMNCHVTNLKEPTSPSKIKTRKHVVEPQSNDTSLKCLMEMLNEASIEHGELRVFRMNIFCYVYVSVVRLIALNVKYFNLTHRFHLIFNDDTIQNYILFH